MPTTSTFKVKVCMVGEAAVGKTSLIRRFVLDQFDDLYTSTLGAKTTKADMEVSDPRGGGTVGVSMLIWDIMGDRQVPGPLLEAFFRGTQGVIAVCDVFRSSTIERMQDWVRMVYKVAGPVPTIYAANKTDLLLEAEALSKERDLKARLSSLHASHAFTSAKTGENVREVFSRLAEEILRQLRTESPGS